MGLYCGERALSLGEAEPVMYSSLNHLISQWHPAVPATPPSSSCAPGSTQGCSLDATGLQPERRQGCSLDAHRVAAWTRRVAAWTRHRAAGHATILQPHVHAHAHVTMLPCYDAMRCAPWSLGQPKCARVARSTCGVRMAKASPPPGVATLVMAPGR